MKIAHICNNYVDSAVHAQLICAIAKINPTWFQTVFVPVRKRVLTPGLTDVPGIKILFRKCIWQPLRFFPIIKQLGILGAAFFQYRDFRNADVFVAHTLWTDGVVCYVLAKLLRKRYVVFVRNTDVNVFLPKLPHYRWLMGLIASNASRVVFVNEAYFRSVPNRYGRVFRSSSVCVLYNAIDDFWMRAPLPGVGPRKPVVLFVGRFNENKNIPSVLDAIEKLRESGLDFSLRMFGGSEDEFLAVSKLSKVPPWVYIGGKVGVEVLLAEYQSALALLVPSFRETFGLVYIEALSQGCGCVFTQGQGVDGVLPSSRYFVAVNPSDTKAMAQAIYLMWNNDCAEERQELILHVRKDFRWSSRAEVMSEWLLSAISKVVAA